MTDEPFLVTADDDAAMAATTRSAHVEVNHRPSLKVLLVTWYFPPANAVAAIRLGKMARYFRDAGHRVRVMTPDRRDDDRSLPVEIDDDVVKRTPYWDLDQRFNPAHRPGFGGKSSTSSPTSLQHRLVRKGRRLLGRFYRDIVLYPDRRIDWLFTLLPALRREIGNEQPDLILVSGPPFSSCIATAIVAWWQNIPWIAEFRDRWVDDPYAIPPQWRTRFDHGVERLLIRRAAGIVTVSDVWARFYADKYGKPTECVMNGFDPKDFAVDLEPVSGLPLRLLHAGTIYPGRRDPGPLFEAISRHGFTPDELRVQFYGRDLRTVSEQAERMGVGAFVDLGEPVPYRQAIELQKGSDVLLLLQWNDPADEGNVPAKIFEYLATNRQILGLGPLNGIPARLVGERQAGLFSNDPDEIAQQLRLWLAEKQKTGRLKPPGRKAALGLNRDAQYRCLDSFCQAVVAEEKTHRQTARQTGRPNRLPALSATLKSPKFAEVNPGAIAVPTLTVIIDTEADFDWSAPFTRDHNGTTSVLHQGRAQTLFDRFGVKPTYLIDYPVATDPDACAILRDFIDRGVADVGIQLHPWTNPPFDELLSTKNSYPSNLPKALQQAKIERLVESVRKNFELEPKVFKSGRFGFNDDTAELLDTFGLDIDTSVVPFTDFSGVQGPNFQGCPHRPFWFGRERRLLELPVTRNLCGLLGRRVGPSLLPIIQSEIGLACHGPGILARSRLLDRLTLTPEGMELDDLKRLTTALLRRGERLFTLVYHSPSLAPGNTPYVRNEAELQAFLQRIEQYLQFFMETIGGEGKSALEIRDLLLCGDTSPAAPTI